MVTQRWTMELQWCMVGWGDVLVWWGNKVGVWGEDIRERDGNWE